MKSIAYLLVTIGYLNAQEQPSAIDTFHELISSKVIEYSELLDIKINKVLTTILPQISECNASLGSTQLEQKNIVDTYDRFFQNARYFSTTDDVFIRLRIQNALYMKDEDRLTSSVRAQIPLRRCKEQWRLFVSDTLTDQETPLPQRSRNNDIAIRYFSESNRLFQTNISLGLQDNGYVQAVISKRFRVSDWIIEPMQIFRYSQKKRNEESTYLYIDKPIGESQLLRFLTYRTKTTRNPGVTYGATLGYLYADTTRSGWRLEHSVLGNTRHLNRSGFYQNKLYRHETAMGYRQEFLRKWIYLETTAIVRLEERYDYNPYFGLMFTFDFYFGKI